jgi:hypothetical protein
MSASHTYVLDANSFIEAKRRYYAFDLCPGFWEALLWHHERGAIGSIDRVKTELQRGGDDLTKWVETVMPTVCFASTDSPPVIDCFRDVMSWVQAQPQFLPEAKAEFAGSADAWLVAYAKVTGRVLVTQEVLNKEVRRKVPIPNVCEAFGVRYLDTFEMLRSLQAQFTWQPQ